MRQNNQHLALIRATPGGRPAPRCETGAHLLAVALREVDDARADGGEADERAGARVPQLRVEALLLCRHSRQALIEAVSETNRPRPRAAGNPTNQPAKAHGSSERARNLGRSSRLGTHLPPAAAAASGRCWPPTTSSSSSPPTSTGTETYSTVPSRRIRPEPPITLRPPPQIGRILQQRQAAA